MSSKPASAAPSSVPATSMAISQGMRSARPARGGSGASIGFLREHGHVELGLAQLGLAARPGGGRCAATAGARAGASVTGRSSALRAAEVMAVRTRLRPAALAS